MTHRRYWGFRLGDTTTWRKAFAAAMSTNGEAWPDDVTGISNHHLDQLDDTWQPGAHDLHGHVPDLTVWTDHHVYWAGEDEGAGYIGIIERHPDEGQQMNDGKGADWPTFRVDRATYQQSDEAVVDILDHGPVAEGDLVWLTDGVTRRLGVVADVTGNQATVETVRERP